MKHICKRLAVLTVGCLMGCMAWADDTVHYLMHIKLSDGTTDVVCVSDHPVVTFDSEHISLKTDRVTVTYPMTEVANYNFDDAEGTDVKSIKMDGKVRYAVQYVDNDHVVVRGAKAADRISVYSVGGQKVKAAVSGEDGDVMVSLEGLARGQYVVNIEGKVSAKVLKK